MSDAPQEQAPEPTSGPDSGSQSGPAPRDDARRPPGPFSGAPAAELVEELLQDPVTGGRAGSTASEVITAALRSVNETGAVLDDREGWRGIAAVALLLTEAAPRLLDTAPRSAELRQYLTRWDTELTPARRTLCSAVLRRLGLEADNEWHAALTRQAGAGAVAALLNPLEGVLADS